MTRSQGSLQTFNTQETTSRPSPFTNEEMDKAIAFFARIVTVYGKSRASALWGKSDNQFRLMRREWTKVIGRLSAEEVEKIFNRLKDRLADGDKDYEWPDITQMLALASDKRGVRAPAHRLFEPAGLPEPEWRKEQRLELGRLASKTCMAVLNGKASFLEDKPSE